MAYFEDLPEEYQNKIIEGLKKSIIKDLEKSERKHIMEEVNNHINVNNDHESIKRFVNDYCL